LLHRSHGFRRVSGDQSVLAHVSGSVRVAEKKTTFRHLGQLVDPSSPFAANSAISR
jgi:hypothetical protein